MKNPRFPLLLMGILVLILLVALSQFWLPGTTNQPVDILGTAVPPLPTLDRNQIAAGEQLYAQYCAECHGETLEGAENWKTPLSDGSFPAPPHDSSGHTWHHPDAQILEIISLGGAVYDGTMPGFEQQLTFDQQKAVLEFIKSHWDTEAREYQWWLSNTVPTLTP